MQGPPADLLISIIGCYHIGPTVQASDLLIVGNLLINKNNQINQIWDVWTTTPKPEGAQRAKDIILGENPQRDSLQICLNGVVCKPPWAPPDFQLRAGGEHVVKSILIREAWG